MSNEAHPPQFEEGSEKKVLIFPPAMQLFYRQTRSIRLKCAVGQSALNSNWGKEKKETGQTRSSRQRPEMVLGKKQKDLIEQV